MVDSPDSNEPQNLEASVEGVEQLSPRPRSPLRRFGCIVALVVWFLVLLTPCFLIRLATEGELRLRLGDAPGQEARVWLVMEADQRGIGYSFPSTHAAAEDASELCIQTDVHYLLWVGAAEGKAIAYCECYARLSDGEAWTLTSTNEGVCTPK